MLRSLHTAWIRRSLWLDEPPPEVAQTLARVEYPVGSRAD
jgi:hypothetical protein